MVLPRHHATLVLPFPDATADALHGALAPEAGTDVPKTRARVHRAPDGVRVELEAEDLPGLRAAVNSYLRWVDAAAKAAQLARGRG